MISTRRSNSHFCIKLITPFEYGPPLVFRATRKCTFSCSDWEFNFLWVQSGWVGSEARLKVLVPFDQFVGDNSRFRRAVSNLTVNLEYAQNFGSYRVALSMLGYCRLIHDSVWVRCVWLNVSITSTQTSKSSPTRLETLCTFRRYCQIWHSSPKSRGMNPIFAQTGQVHQDKIAPQQNQQKLELPQNFKLDPNRLYTSNETRG